MRALGKRHIIKTSRYDALFPKSTGRDMVIVGAGKASLADTVALMQEVIQTTLADTKGIAKLLEGKTLRQTCKQIWEFVYHHIQYRLDKTGVEQVRRPSRTWSDRFSGVDCDCYSVFIGSILSNLGIPFTMRLTKYKGRSHFQHVYPIVPTGKGYITIDCVKDAFDSEEPFSEKKDIPMGQPRKDLQKATTLSGVDEFAIGLAAIEQPSIPLREMSIPNIRAESCITTPAPKATPSVARRTAKVQSPYRFEDADAQMRVKHQKRSHTYWPLVMVSGFTLLTGAGFLSLWEHK